MKALATKLLSLLGRLILTAMTVIFALVVIRLSERFIWWMSSVSGMSDTASSILMVGILTLLVLHTGLAKIASAKGASIIIRADSLGSAEISNSTSVIITESEMLMDKDKAP